VDQSLLAFNTTYYYFVSAFDGTAEGPLTSSSYNSSDGTIPSARITNYSAIDGATITWGASGIINTRVYRDINSSGATKQLLATVIGSNTYSDSTITNPNTTYYYFVNTIDINGTEGPIFNLEFFSGAMLSWIKQMGAMNSTGTDSSPSVSIDIQGNMYVSYTVNGTISGGTRTGQTDIAVSKIDTYGNLVWVKQLGIMNTTANDTSSSITIDSNSNIYISYQSTGTVSGGTFLGGLGDIVVCKLDSNGNLVWIKQHAIANTTTSEADPRIVVDSAGNSYVCYNSAGTISGGTFRGLTDIVIFKLDSNGNLVWIKEPAIINSTGNERYPTIAIDSSGNLCLTYQSAGTVSGGTNIGGTTSDVVVIKMDGNGNVIWIRQRSVMNTSGIDQYPSVAIDNNNNIFVSYHSSGTVSGGTLLGTGTNDIVIFKMDTNGNTLWIRESAMVNTTATDTLSSIAID
jgi:hypothetical protein